MVGGRRPTYPPAISPTTAPCGRAGVPSPTGVPGCAAAGTHAAETAGRRGDVGNTGGGGEGAQEGMGQDTAGVEEAAGEGSTGDGRGGRSSRGTGDRVVHTGGRIGAGG